MNTFLKRKTRCPKLWIFLGILFFLLIWFLLSLGGLRTFLWNSFSLTGFPFSSRDYLVIFQNNYELRPTGGFISAYGILKFRHGFFAGIEISDTFSKIADHPYVEPPYPMADLLAHQFYQGYTFRDANYDPDFPTSAQKLEEFLRINFPEQKVDGVIAVDFKVLEDVIGIFGKLKVDDIIFTKENAFELIEHEISDIDRHSVEEIKDRKNILKDIAKKLIYKAIFRPWKLNNISEMATANLNEKHILVYFKNENLEKKIADKKWGGTFEKPKDTDFISLVEANLGGMKSNRYIERDITYTVDLEKLTAKLEILYNHFGELNVPLSGDYKGFLRTYTSGKNFEEILKFKPGEMKLIIYEYKLPAQIYKENDYKLLLRKQPGTLEDRVHIVVRAPLGMEIKSNNFETRENYAVQEILLKKDVLLSLETIPDVIPPRPVYHEIESLNKIVLHFNEEVDSGLAQDFLNYKITDLNEKNPTEDKIFIKKINHSGRFIEFEIEGMTLQKEERYQIIIQNMKDKSENYLEDTPRTLTLVQRIKSN